MTKIFTESCVIGLMLQALTNSSDLFLALIMSLKLHKYFKWLIGMLLLLFSHFLKIPDMIKS